MSSPASSGFKSASRLHRTPSLRDALAALPRLAGLWPDEVVPPESPAFAGLLARLRRALRAERQRGTAGHWSYDLARHTELVAIYRVLADAHRLCTGHRIAPTSRIHGRPAQRAKKNGPAH